MSQVRPSVVVLLLCGLSVGTLAAQDAPILPSPLRLADVIRLAVERRDEVEAARARMRAAEARPAIVSALADPMIAPSLDHLPFSLGGADVSATLEQQIPLSGVRRHRRLAAMADVDRLTADVQRTRLDVGVEAANAFVMLHARRRTAALLTEQLGSAREVVSAADARYASGSGPQSDVLRAELEVARLTALDRASAGEVRAAEAMLAAALALDAGLPVPELVLPSVTRPIPDWPAIRTALIARPELAAGRADVARATAGVQVMRDMFRPMATIRTGPSYTMADGHGWMAMVGLSLPIWRGKLRAGVAEAEAMRAMSEADLRAMARMIEGEAAVAVSELQAAQARHAAIVADVLPRARLTIDPAVASYAAGQLPLVSVIEAIQSLWRVQAELIATETAVSLAWARLGRAIGSYEEIVP